jgi:hypothetical protein
MEKQILTIGYNIPTLEECGVDFHDSRSLMDADILLISPESLSPRDGYGSWIEFSSGGGCYNVPTSSEYERKISHLKKEVADFLQSGKNVFLILSKQETHVLSSGVSHPRKGENHHSTYSKTNYDFLPISIGNIVSASGRNVAFSGNTIFHDFNDKFNKNLEYQLYLEDMNGAEILFTGKDKTKVLGAIFKVKNGNLIVLPYINYDEKKFTEVRGKGNKEYWTKEAAQFGKALVKALIDIDKSLRKSGDRTQPPDWTNDVEFELAQEQIMGSDAENIGKEIERLTLQKRELLTKIDEEIRLRDLIFEKGKVLENAITIALEILGYNAENYNDGNLELDHVISSPEGDRFIGEAEGKDISAVNIDKFRQLALNLQEDLQRDEVEDLAIGILFGNGFRLTKPSERPEQFTAKCISSAKSLNYILVRTSDLFRVAKYIKETKNKTFAKSCRDTLKNSLGGIVDFPHIPT